MNTNDALLLTTLLLGLLDRATSMGSLLTKLQTEKRAATPAEWAAVHAADAAARLELVDAIARAQAAEAATPKPATP